MWAACVERSALPKSNRKFQELKVSRGECSPGAFEVIELEWMMVSNGRAYATLLIPLAGVIGIGSAVS